MKRKVILFMSIILLCFIVSYTAIKISFPEAHSKSTMTISDISVNAQSRKLGANASYHLTFTIHKMLPKNSWIKIQFPDEFGFSETHNSSYIDIDSDKRVITYFLSKDYLPDTDSLKEKRVTITIPYLIGIRNPIFAGVFVLKISTENDIEWTNSNSFSILDSQIGFPVGVPKVTVTSPVPKKLSSYLIEFNVGEAGWLKKGEGTIRLRFPRGTVFSKESIENDNILVNGTPLEEDLITRGSMIIFNTPIEVNDSEFIEILISEKAGIINPTQSGTYSLFVSTMPADPLWVSSSPYEINE
jgi:hypothetical protein